MACIYHPHTYMIHVTTDEKGYEIVRELGEIYRKARGREEKGEMIHLNFKK